HGLPAFARVLCIARTRVRYLARSRAALVAFLLAVLPWFALDRHDADAELGLLTGSVLVGMLASASGVVADSLDNGSYCIGVLHGVTPIEMLLGEATGALSGLIPVVGAFTALSSTAFNGVPLPALLSAFAWLVVLLLGWLGIMLVLGTALPGKGNAIAMIPLLVAFAFPSDALPVDSWPPLLARVARTSWDAMPLQSHATAMYAAVLHGATPPPIAPFALLLAPTLYLTLAAIRLSRLEAAGRFAR
ncbi:MAG TPA: hypothetical protein VNB89_07565, partial [Gemmatimonadaceae bacterium]|nr:hypothetical protein [Gemmatimonadaceae bacterium]